MDIHADLTSDELLLLIGDREVTIYRLRKRVNALDAQIAALTTPSTPPSPETSGALMGPEEHAG